MCHVLRKDEEEGKRKVMDSDVEESKSCERQTNESMVKCAGRRYAQYVLRFFQGLHYWLSRIF
jgi:hypothetical protein